MQKKKIVIIEWTRGVELFNIQYLRVVGSTSDDLVDLLRATNEKKRNIGTRKIKRIGQTIQKTENKWMKEKKKQREKPKNYYY